LFLAFEENNPLNVAVSKRTVKNWCRGIIAQNVAYLLTRRNANKQKEMILGIKEANAKKQQSILDSFNKKKSRMDLNSM